MKPRTPRPLPHAAPLALITAVVLLTAAGGARAAEEPALPARWDELTASDWPRALQKAAHTIILPIGILEKHGPHAPIGSDLIHVREWAARATKREYAVVFPDFFYGQIYEARHQPGTLALPSRLVWDLLEAVCEEMGRNGFKKIVIINGHGGNPNLLRYFAQAQLERRRSYVLYLYEPATDPAFAEKVKAARRSDPSWDAHAGERETSTLLYLRPDLVQQDRATRESGKNLARLAIPEVFTGIGWYASYPNHYAGEGAKASRELGQLLTEQRVESLARVLKAVKADAAAPRLQREFEDRASK